MVIIGAFTQGPMHSISPRVNMPLRSNPNPSQSTRVKPQPTCNGDHGCVDASSHALHLSQSEHAVRGGLPNVDAKLLNQRVLNVLSTLQPVINMLHTMLHT
jgi:hypothetical protein